MKTTKKCALDLSERRVIAIMGAVNSTEDTRQYREGYPGKEDDPSATRNAEFYRNERGAEPNRQRIDEILQPAELGGWFGDWELLERKHNYIQISAVGRGGAAVALGGRGSTRRAWRTGSFRFASRA